MWISVRLRLLPLALLAGLLGCETVSVESTGAHLRWNVLRKVASIPRSSSHALIEASSLALTQDESLLVVGTATRTSLVLLDPETLEVLDTIHTGDGTGQICAVDEGRYMVAWATQGRIKKRRGKRANFSHATEVFILDGLSGQLLHRVDVGENIGMLHDLDDGTVLITAVQGQRISRVDLESGRVLESVSTRKEGFSPGYITGRPDGRIGVVTGGVYRASVGGSRSRAQGTEVLVLDPMRPKERSRFEVFDGLKHPRSVLFHPDGRHILVAERGNDTLVTLDWVSRRTVDVMQVPHHPELLGLLPGGTTAYLSYDGAERITRVNLATGALEHTVLPGTPRVWGQSGPVVSADERFLYVPVRNEHGVAVIELSSFGMIDFIDTPKAVSSLAISGRGDVLFATLGDGHYVARIE
jgi:DNA-binding beta-propeller fold protein YncE